jgi:peptide deformylase
MNIIQYGDPVLVNRAENVTEAEILTKDFQDLCELMLSAVREKCAVGLAAPQIGVSKRVFVISTQFVAPGRYPLQKSDLFETLFIINPELSEPSQEQDTMLEGCLSLGELRVPVLRPKKIHVKAFNQKAERLDFVATGFLARAIQHETDHLNGILMLERVAPENFKLGGFKSTLDAIKIANDRTL